MCRWLRHFNLAAVEQEVTSYRHLPSLQDQTDGSGKRRLDNGEVGRWKLTDDPPPKKKALPTLEEAGRGDGSHKRKKEREGPQDSGPKKKVRTPLPNPQHCCVLIGPCTDLFSFPCSSPQVKGAHEKRLKKV